eukprot:3850004-Alexandrium_andersonii.AAC.1
MPDLQRSEDHRGPELRGPALRSGPNVSGRSWRSRSLAFASRSPGALRTWATRWSCLLYTSPSPRD